MRARRPGRHSDEVMGPRALAAMADAARRSREAGAGPSRAQSDAATEAVTAVAVDGAAGALIDPEPSAPDTMDPSSAPGTPPPTPPVARPSPSTPDPPPTAATPVPPAPSTPPSRPSTPVPAPSATSATSAGTMGAASASEPRHLRTPTHGDHRRRSSMLIVSVSLMAIVAAVLGTWAVKDGGGGSPSTSRRPGTSAHTAPVAPPVAQSGHESGAAAPSPGTTSVTTTTQPATTTTTTAATPNAGSGPVLNSIQPASGSAGQTIVVSGSNLLSASGQITAQFGAETSTVACLAQTSCLVIVPPDGSPAATIPVTITTDNGTSNALTFTYS